MEVQTQYQLNFIVGHFNLRGWISFPEYQLNFVTAQRFLTWSQRLVLLARQVSVQTLRQDDKRVLLTLNTSESSMAEISEDDLVYFAEGR